MEIRIKKRLGIELVFSQTELSSTPPSQKYAVAEYLCLFQVMRTYHMYNADSISAQSKLKEAEKQEEKQIGKSVKQEDKQTPRSPDSASSVKFEEKHVRRSSVKKIEKMKEKVCERQCWG